MAFCDTAPEGLYPLQADDGQWLAPASPPVFAAWHGASGPGEISVRTSSETGERQWLIVPTAPYFAPLTRARRLIVTVTDITAERQPATQLERNVVRRQDPQKTPKPGIAWIHAGLRVASGMQ